MVKIGDEEKQFLYEELESYKKVGGQFEAVPYYISNNLSPEKKLREYQKDCFEQTIYWHEHLKHNQQVRLLFHMATGSGKTLIMAGMILYYYKQGYRNFMFFVNQNNIIAKTKDNFLDKMHDKYLFAQKIVIDNRLVEIKETDTFSDIDEDAMNIKFTTIQQLSNDLSLIGENKITPYTFKEDKFVLIADEAHHLNAETKKRKNEKDTLNINSWESTVNNILAWNKESVLLEFTATADFRDKQIVEKYLEHTIFEYDILRFRNDKYTKDFINYSSTFDDLHRLLNAMLFSQYRLKRFADYKLNIKPVILAKLKTKNEKRNFIDKYLDFINNKIIPTDIDQLRPTAEGVAREMFDYFNEHEITSQDLIDEIKLSFNKEQIIELESGEPDNILSEKQKTVNNLESRDNPIRLVFVVDMLHEGWDVLNLYDIVRLYETRDGGKGKIGQSTIQEAQLIGRGVRYYPFKVSGDEIADKRKYDGDPNNPLKICETLYYHSQDNSRYISELRRALKQIGMDFEERISFDYIVKDKFKITDFYQRGSVFINARREIENSANQIPDNMLFVYYRNYLQDANVTSLIEDTVLDDKFKEKGYSSDINIATLAKEGKYSLVYSAMRKHEFFSFDILHQYFPQLKSINEFITSPMYLGKFSVTIVSKKKIPSRVELHLALIDFFDKLASKLSSWQVRYEGTRKFAAQPISKYIINVHREKTSPDEFGEGRSQNSANMKEKFKLDLSNYDWYVYNDNYGTTEEKSFVKYFSGIVDRLKKMYEEVYLIRNERQIHFYSFDEGGRFEPDYLLFLKKNKDDKCYEQQQIFVEPKGNHLLKQDAWKEKFMLQLEEEGIAKPLLGDTNDYKILGLPFYNELETLPQFSAAISKKLLNNTTYDFSTSSAEIAAEEVKDIFLTSRDFDTQIKSEYK